MTTLDVSTALPTGWAKPKSIAARTGVNPQLLARLTGFLFLVTFITSIPPVLTFYVPVLSDPNYILGAGADAGLAWGAVLELLLIIANIGTALALFPVLKRQNEALALGFVASRLIECAFIAIGILSLLAIGTLRQAADGADPASMLAVGKALVALHDWTFRLGPGFVCGIGNGMILGWLMFRSGLMPRALTMLGLVGGPLIALSGAAVVLGYIAPMSMAQGLATVPEFFWELSVGLVLMIRGFAPKALKTLMGGGEI